MMGLQGRDFGEIAFRVGPYQTFMPSVVRHQSGVINAQWSAVLKWYLWHALIRMRSHAEVGGSKNKVV